jgi:hypothetical protein
MADAKFFYPTLPSSCGLATTFEAVQAQVVADRQRRRKSDLSGRGSGPTDVFRRLFGRDTAFNWPWLLPLKMA